MMGTGIKNAERLIKDVNNKIAKWNERSNFVIKGVSNLSISDLEDLILYAETFKRSYSFKGLMSPRGKIEEVLTIYGLEDGYRYL